MSNAHVDGGPKSFYVGPGADLDASLTAVTLTPNQRDVPKPGSEEEKSQKVCSDHMISARWTIEAGWERPQITPYGPLPIMPTANVLHYATECFEGMKLYRGLDGKLRLFRPYENALRMVRSAARISLPTFNPEELVSMLRQLCALDGPKWLPKERRGSFLYLRPAIIGTDSCLGFEVPKEALLFVVISYWPQPPAAVHGKGLRLFASREAELRAWPGGTGHAKIGPNYGPALLAHGQAKRQGYDQVLWLFGRDCQITEAGSSNVFVMRRAKSGVVQLITASLAEQTILAGITRNSVLELVRGRMSKPVEVALDLGNAQRLDAVEVVERVYTMSELQTDLKGGNLLGMFVVGTAAFVTLVSEINFRGTIIKLDTEGCPHIQLLRRWLHGIMYGLEASDWVEVIEESP